MKNIINKSNIYAHEFNHNFVNIDVPLQSVKQNKGSVELCQIIVCVLADVLLPVMSLAICIGHKGNLHFNLKIYYHIVWM